MNNFYACIYTPVKNNFNFKTVSLDVLVQIRLPPVVLVQIRLLFYLTFKTQNSTPLKYFLNPVIKQGKL